ncbi:Ubiquitin-like domain-containing protein [Entamoeba marina]
MSLLTLKNNYRPPTLVEYRGDEKIHTIVLKIMSFVNVSDDRICLYFHNKLVDPSLTFSQVGIVGGAHLLYLIKGEGNDTSSPTDPIIEMLEKGISYTRAKLALEKAKYQVNDALEMVYDDESSFSETDTYSDEDDSTSEFIAPGGLQPTYQPIKSVDVFQPFYQYDSSADFAEEIISDNIKSSDSYL